MLLTYATVGYKIRTREEYSKAKNGPMKPASSELDEQSKND